MPDSNGSPTAQDLIELRESMAAFREWKHGQSNRQGSDEAIARMLTDIRRKVEDKPQPDEPPTWTKLIAPVSGVAVILSIVGGFLWNASENRTAAARTEAQMVARIAAIETGMDTAKRIRDQQTEAMRDQIKLLQLSDQTGADALNRMLQSMSGITAELQGLRQGQQQGSSETNRRLERLENRLGARPGSGSPDELPTSLTLPL